MIPLLFFAVLFWAGGVFPSPSGAAADEARAISQKEIDREVAAGRKVADEIEKQFELVSDPVRVVRLSTILDRLTSGLEIKYPWQVKIIRRDELNAFCLPGGYIYFFDGFVDMLRSDGEIAAIMAHEIAHVVGRHGMKQSARDKKLTVASLVLILATGGAAAPAVAATMAHLAIMNSYSLEYEQEADIVGMQMLIEAGYPPSAVVTTMETLMGEEIKTPLYRYRVYRDHPDTIKRVEYLAQYLRDRKIPLKRKEALLSLRTDVSRGGGSVSLTVDGAEVWSGPDNNEVYEVIERARKAVDSSLQMELAPYEIAADGGSLRIRNTVIAEEPLPSGMQPLSSAREKLLEAVLAAQRKHPIAKYFK